MYTIPNPREGVNKLDDVDPEFLKAIGLRDEREFVRKFNAIVASAYEENADKPKSNTIRDKLSARRFNLGKPPPLPRPIYSMAGRVICTPGNLLELSANNKTCKTTYLTSGFIAASFGLGGDTLGIKSANPHKYALIHFDTEQSPFHQHRVVATALARVGVNDNPGWLRSYRLADISTPSELVQMLQYELRVAKEEHRGIHSVLLDGVADFVLDVNDSKACPEFVAKLHQLAIEYDTVIVCILHLNPNSDNKSRGHLGSQLERKAETVLRLVKAKDGIFTAYTACSRNAPIYKEDGPRYQWSDEKAMHVSLDQTAHDDRVSQVHREVQTLAKQVFGTRLLDYQEAWKAIADIESPQWRNASKEKQANYEQKAKRIFTRIKAYGFIEQTPKRKGAPWRLKTK